MSQFPKNSILLIKRTMKKFCFLFISIILTIVIVYYFQRILKRKDYYMEITKPPILISKEIIKKFYLNFTELSSDLNEYFLKSDNLLKKKIFPWLKDLNLYRGEKNSSGIVICTGNGHIRLSLIALKSLVLISNELPVEIMYSTSNDLSLDNQNLIKKQFPNVELIDLSLNYFNDSYLNLRGWEIKPFAVLASKFEKVILMDADVLFLEKPSILFHNKYFLQTGTLFFYDRPNLSEKISNWIKTFSQNNKQTIPTRTQESGVVLIDKSRVLFGLLSTCKLNDHQERQHVTYKYLYGDKDTWWLGFHIIQIPYSFIPTMTASIGTINKDYIVCGHILHLDENSQPIWWNGGMFRNRYINTKDLLNINGWLEEGQWNIQIYSCLTNYQKTAKQFKNYHKQLINGYNQIAKLVFNIPST